MMRRTFWLVLFQIKGLSIDAIVEPSSTSWLYTSIAFEARATDLTSHVSRREAELPLLNTASSSSVACAVHGVLVPGLVVAAGGPPG